MGLVAWKDPVAHHVQLRQFWQLLLPPNPVLRILCNMVESGNVDEKATAQALQERLPPGWRVRIGRSAKERGLVLEAPDGRRVAVEVKRSRQLEPMAALHLVRQLRHQGGSEPVVVVAPFLSARTREVLDEAAIPYLDLTGNARLAFDEPGLFIHTTGAERDPRREERPARSLKGDKAARVVRQLIDFRRPAGVRALADATGVNAGYVSRVLTLLESQALIERDARGQVTNVSWDKVLRRWADDAPLSSRGPSATFIDPRGVENVLRGLKTVHAITGSLAAARIAPVAPSRLATIYVNDIGDAASILRLRETDAGANVLLIAPRDAFVFERSETKNGLTYAAPSQVAADLLSSPGRGPAEGEELIRWMKSHAEAWRG